MGGTPCRINTTRPLKVANGEPSPQGKALLVLLSGELNKPWVFPQRSEVAVATGI